MGITAYVVLSFFASFVGFENGSVPLVTIVGMGFGVYTMHSLGSLSSKLEEFDTHNKKLSEENKKMESSVNRFQKQNEEMKKSTDALLEENRQVKQQVDELSASVDALDSIQQKLQAYADEHHKDFHQVIGTIKGALQEQKDIVAKQQDICSQTENATKDQAKILLHTIHRQCQFMDQSMGMSPMEFQMFLGMVPQKYKAFAGELSFEGLDAGSLEGNMGLHLDKDGVINIQEFEGVVERLIDLGE